MGLSMKSTLTAASLALALCIAAPARSQNGLLLSEFMADNSKTLQDEDKEFSDWVEVFNGGDAPVNLDGYCLTDEIDTRNKWRFPAVTLEPMSFLVVFCSGNNRRDPARELHTNFRLDNDTEDVLLVAPDGVNVLSGFRTYPEQQADISYGLQTDARFFRPIPPAAPARVHVPAGPDLGLTWTETDFDDAGWRQGPLAVGFGVTGAEAAALGTDVGPEMLRVNPSVYVRIPFELAEVPPVDILKLRIKYDDGFAAFLNGVPVAAVNAPTALAWNSAASRAHSPTLLEEIDISQHRGALRAGKNVLAIQGMNSAVAGNDVYILPELEMVDVQATDPQKTNYFPQSTPRQPNVFPGFPQAAPRPFVTPQSGTYVDGVEVELGTSLPGAVIRFTADETTPTESSTEYGGPFEVTGASRIIARVFKDGFLPGPPTAVTYLVVAQANSDFSSNLPIVVCTTFARPMGTNCGGGPYTPGHIMVIEPGPDGRANITDEPTVSTMAQFRRRGSSTCGNEKFSFNVEVIDLQGRDREVDVFNFPRESDYIMYAPNNFDRSLMRNPIAYWMSREVGWWAARSRNVECVFHIGRGPISFNTRTFTPSYFGVYNFMEKCKQHPLKIDVAQITPQDRVEPEVSGGYVLRRDRVGQGEVTTDAGGYSSLVFVYPKLPITQQRTYITQFINRAIASLNPRVGKQEDNDNIDFTGWIDHHILNWYPKNVDAFRLSGYFHKDRGGRLVMGPVWDYDRTMGCSDDDRARDPLGWENDNVGDGGTDYFQAGGLGSWYSHLFSSQPPMSNTPWNEAYRNRWRELRRGPLKTQSISAQVEAWGTEMAEAAERNFARWPGNRPRFGSYQGEVNHLKNWLATRADWIDAQFIERPRFDPAGGFVDAGLQVQILISTGAKIIYTMDGTDPRGTDSKPSAAAVEYTGPITIGSNVKMRARALEGDSFWTGLTEETYVVEEPNLMVTELMYNPAPPTPQEDPDRRFTAARMEFIEITNVGDTAVPLLGVKFTRGVTFGFDEVVPIQSIGPRESLVLVVDAAAFRARYGNGPRIGGQYRGAFAETSEAVTIVSPLGQPLVDFTYNSTWYPETNAGGRSLVNADPLAPNVGLSDPARWRPSSVANGTPGVLELAQPTGQRRPGDANADGRVSMSDAIRLVWLLFRGAQAFPCEEGGAQSPGNRAILDWSGDAKVDVTDVIHSLHYLFLAGPPHFEGGACKPVLGCAEQTGGACGG